MSRDIEFTPFSRALAEHFEKLEPRKSEKVRRSNLVYDRLMYKAMASDDFWKMRYYNAVSSLQSERNRLLSKREKRKLYNLNVKKHGKQKGKR